MKLKTLFIVAFALFALLAGLILSSTQPATADFTAIPQDTERYDTI